MTTEDKDKLNLKFVETQDGSIPCLQVVLTVEINDSVLMFHICHMYRNAMLMDEREAGKLQEFKDTCNFQLVLLSLQESLKQRLKEGGDTYINEHYKAIRENQNQFDECLDLFVKVKSEFVKYRAEYLNKYNTQFREFV